MDKEEKLIKAMYSGYQKAMSECLFGEKLYTAAFLDGMKYQKDGTIPESAIDRAFREAFGE